MSSYHVQFDLTPGGYWMYGYVTVTRLPGRGGHCLLAAPIPNDATHVREFGFHTERTSGPARLVSAVASVSAGSGPDPPAPIGLEYFSPNVERDGWGEVSLTLPALGKAAGTRTGELVSASGTVLSGPPIAPVPEDVTVSCPPGSNTVSAYPAGAIQTNSAVTDWTGLQQNTFLDVRCQNPQVRFWVDHATDLIVLGLGAILGALVAIDPRRRRARRSAPILTPASATATGPRPAARISTSMLGFVLLAAMIRRTLRIAAPGRRGDR